MAKKSKKSAHQGASSSTSVNTKTSTAHKNHNPRDNPTTTMAAQKRKFEDKSKKKKTFLGRCKKLLHGMLELEDSKPFRSTVDRNKYPDFLSSVRYDIHLSGVSEKLSLGQYQDPNEFARDVRLMVTNWNGYIKDQSLPIFSQITRLSWYFEAEFSKIQDAYQEHRNKKRRTDESGSLNPLVTPVPVVPPTPPHLCATVASENLRLRITRAPSTQPQKNSSSSQNLADLRHKINNAQRSTDTGSKTTPQQSGSRGVTRPASKTATIDALNAIRQAMASQSRGTSASTPPNTESPSRPNSISANPFPPRNRPQTTAGNSGNKNSHGPALGRHGSLISSEQGLNYSQAMTGDLSRPQRPNSGLARQQQGHSSYAAAAASNNSFALPPIVNRPSQGGYGNTSRSQQRNHVSTPRPSTPATTPNTGTPSSTLNTKTPSTSTATPTTAATDDNKSPDLELLFTANHVWYGECKNKPPRDLRFTEKFFEIPIKSETSEGIFRVKMNEIVRCCGHFGNLGKLQNTLFIFLTPSATKTLRSCMRDIGLKGDPCSLIVVFSQNLDRPKQSLLIHIFWQMGRSSIFGNPFNEVDKKGALSILANIKPQILQKLVVSAREEGDGGSRTPQSNASTPSPTVSQARTVTPNLAAARTRRNSSSNPSSTTPDHESAPANLPQGGSTNPSYTFQRSRLPHHSEAGHQPPVGFGRGYRPQGPMQQQQQFSNGRPGVLGPVPNMPPMGPRFRNMDSNQFNGQNFDGNAFNRGNDSNTFNRGNMENGHLNGRFQNSYRSRLFNNFTQDGSYDSMNTWNSPAYNQQPMPPSPWCHDRNEGFDTGFDQPGSYWPGPDSEEQPLNQEGENVPNVEENTTLPPPRGISSTAEESDILNDSGDIAATRDPNHLSQTVDLFTNASIDTNNQGRLFIQITTQSVQPNNNTQSAAHDQGIEDTSALDEDLSLDQAVDFSTVESTVSSSVPAVNNDQDNLLVDAPQTAVTEETESEPVSSSAPGQSAGETSAEDDEGHVNRQNQPQGGDCGQAETEMHEITDESEDDLFIIDEENEGGEDMSFIPTSKQKEEEDDLVMMAARISIKCPVTQQVMRRPMKNRHCAHCYDRDGINQLIINRMSKARCPVPGCSNQNTLQLSDMEFDWELFSHIKTHINDDDIKKELVLVEEEMGKA